MKILIIERNYINPTILSNSYNRPISFFLNFPCGSIILYESEYFEGFCHFEYWSKYKYKVTEKVPQHYNTSYLVKIEARRIIIKHDINNKKAFLKKITKNVF